VSGMEKHALPINREECLILVARMIRLLRAEARFVPMPPPSAVVKANLVAKLPNWVARYGLLMDGENAWLYCESYVGIEPDGYGQVVLGLPAGRYFIDTFEAGANSCRSRESATGNPIVAGLAFTERPILLWIRPSGGIEEK
jgi:hypothetical protein